MPTPSKALSARRRPAALAAALGVAFTVASATTDAQEPAAIALPEATIADLHGAMQSGLLTAESLAARYAARIAAYDRIGPQLRAVIAVNPDLLAEARRRDLDLRATGRRGALFGIPVLLKDNIDALPMPTTAGSLALTASFPPDDSFVAARLRAAGAVVLGKANLTEFANFMTTQGMPNGYSAVGGHGVNPYDTRRNANGSAVHDPGGSSSGSGIAAAANLAAVAIGTETSGSILSPSSTNGVVGIKPTVGLVSRDGILPITADQDTAGPIARTVRDAAIVLGVIAGHDPNDPATAACLTPGNCFSDYTQFLDRGALLGARIGVPPPEFPLSSEQQRIVRAAIGTLRAAGAVVVDPYPAQNPVLPPICVTHPASPGESTVLIFGMKRDLEAYLRGLGPTAPRRSLADILAFNLANAGTALRYGQTILAACDRFDATPNGADDLRYRADRQTDVQLARGWLDAAYAGPDGQRGTGDDFEALLFPANFGANAPARAGYPSVCVPAGFVSEGGGAPRPFGVTFSGPAFSEPRLLALAWAFEQATLHRLPPASAPALPTDTIPLGRAGVRPLGRGCNGSNGVPGIATAGAPIAGNGAFGVALSSLRGSAPAFVGVSAASGLRVIGSCLVFPRFPFDVVFAGASDATGAALVDVPLPWDPALVGALLFVQGGALDPQGGALGVASLSAALELTLGG